MGRRAVGTVLAALVVIALVVSFGVRRDRPADVVSGGGVSGGPSAPVPGEPSTGPTVVPLPEPSPEVPGVVPAPPPDALRMRVTYVYDGDTVQLQRTSPNDLVTIDAPFRVRLIGVNAPEATTQVDCYGREATSFLRTLLPVGSEVLVGRDRDTWDDYKRRLFYLWLPDGRFVDREIVAAGFARAIRVWPNVAHATLLAQTQTAAQAGRIGLWGAC